MVTRGNEYSGGRNRALKTVKHKTAASIAEKTEGDRWVYHSTGNRRILSCVRASHSRTLKPSFRDEQEVALCDRCRSRGWKGEDGHEAGPQPREDPAGGRAILGQFN